MNKVYLLLGGNIGDSVSIFQNCEKIISHKIGEIVCKSSYYQSPSWGFDDENKFLNQVLEISTSLDESILLSICLEIENELGRFRDINIIGYQSRIIDIDILFFNDLFLFSDRLQLPHPRLHLRRFTLLPLCEIAKDLIHPKFKESVESLLLNCEDHSQVTRL